jgi:hypothetical protein
MFISSAPPQGNSTGNIASSTAAPAFSTDHYLHFSSEKHMCPPIYVGTYLLIIYLCRALEEILLSFARLREWLKTQ